MLVAKRWIFLTLLVMCCAGLAWSILGPRRHTFSLDGRQRDYLLHTPAGAGQLEGKRPLVLVMHGGSGTHRNMVRQSRGRWNELADQHGFYVVYPNAVKKHWNFGEGKTSLELKDKVDDLAYFNQLLEDVCAENPIDSERIFATGISRGGQACYFLAGKMPGVFRGVAPVAMPLPEHFQDDCESGPPCALVLINGTADPQVPYEGGVIEVFGMKRDRVLSTDRTVEVWRERNQCTGEPEVTKIDPEADNTSVEKFAWSGEAPVVLYRIENGGHTWPRGTQYLPVKLVGEVSQDIDGAEVAWEVFSEL